MAVSLIANDAECTVLIVCNQLYSTHATLSVPLGFAMNEFKIGQGFIGRIREFTFYKVAMGIESFTKVTTSKESISQP